MSASTIDDFYRDPTTVKRDTVVNGRLGIYDLRYQDFVAGLSREKQNLDVSNDLLLLAFGLAGTVTSAVRAKTNLAAATAGIGGAKTSIDKHYFHEKTIAALVAAMDSQRATVRLRIMTGIQEPIDVYGLPQALSDLQSYYAAGTLHGATKAIQVDASEKEKSANIAIARLEKVTEEAIDERKSIRLAIRALTANDIAKAKAALSSLGEKNIPDTFDAMKTRLQEIHAESRSEAARTKLKKALTDANVPIPAAR